jgi:hypothetical protein
MVAFQISVVVGQTQDMAVRHEIALVKMVMASLLPDLAVACSPTQISCDIQAVAKAVFIQQ